MIAVFEAMATQGGNARSMAAGVSMATVPTMSGMVAALSGVMGTTYLQTKIKRETELFEDNLTLDH
jgi:biopolymer transport protein ExbB